jgi:hypothetical protein
MGRQVPDRHKWIRDLSLHRQRNEGDIKGHRIAHGAGSCAQTWFAKAVVYCANAGNDQGEVFKYPDGGWAIAVFSGNFVEPLGTVAVEK